MLIPPPEHGPARSKWISGSFVLAFLVLLSHRAGAGTWTFRKWTSNRDIPLPAPDVVTQAIAFGVPSNTPVMAPFLLTNKIFGQTWSVWTYPDHTKMVRVERMAEVRKDALRLGGEGASLVHGHAYNIASFGLALSVDRDFRGKINTRSMSPPATPRTSRRCSIGITVHSALDQSFWFMNKPPQRTDRSASISRVRRGAGLSGSAPCSISASINSVQKSSCCQDFL